MIVEFKTLSEIKKGHSGGKIVCCTGTFDLTHAGHVLFFEDAKKLGDILVVNVARDSLIKGYKGNSRPVLNESIRMKMIDSIKAVNYTVLDNQLEWKGEKTHELTLSPFFELLKPDIYVINNDGIDYSERERICIKHGVKLHILKRWCPPEFNGISTSQIIENIKKLDEKIR